MAYLARRTGQALIVLAIAFTATFVLLQALPGDAILIKFESPELGLSPEQIADIRASYGADVPPVQQFLHTVAGFVQGDFGYSVQYGTPVHELIGSALPDTLVLAGLGFLTAVLIVLILTLRTAVRILTLRSSEPTNVADSCAPKIVDFSMTDATSGVIGPIGACAPEATCGRLLSSWNSAKKNGDCSRIGRHEENGLEPVLL